MRRVGLAILLLMLLYLGACREPAAEQSQPVKPGIEEETRSPQSLEPDESVTPPQQEEVEQTPLSLEEADLSFSISTSEKGFQLVMDPLYDPVIIQTLAAPGNKIVHVVRRMGDEKGAKRAYRRDAVVVDPITPAVRVYPLTYAWVLDTYSVDSISHILGFQGNEHAIFIEAQGPPEGELTYHINRLNLNTGKSEVLVANAPSDVGDDFYGMHWLTSDGRYAVLNAFTSGETWIADLKEKSVRKLSQTFKNDWPYFAITPSPVGDRFWYYGKLYNKDGELIVEPNLDYVYLDRPVWSEDGRYTALHYSLEDSKENWLDGGERGILAPQALSIYGKDGKSIYHTEETEPGKHVELAGWLPESERMVIERYEVDFTGPMGDQKVKRSYEIHDVSVWSVGQLQPSGIEEMERLEPVISWKPFRYGPTLHVDQLSGLYTRVGEGAPYLGELINGEILWVEAEEGSNESMIRSFSQEHGVRAVMEWGPMNTTALYHGRWLVDTQTLHYVDMLGE